MIFLLEDVEKNVSDISSLLSLVIFHLNVCSCDDFYCSLSKRCWFMLQRTWMMGCF